MEETMLRLNKFSHNYLYFEVNLLAKYIRRGIWVLQKNCIIKITFVQYINYGGNMEFTTKEIWGSLHGFIFGGLYLLAFSGGLYALFSLRAEWLTVEGIKAKLIALKIAVWSMSAAVWAAVISGTYIVYPWYRANPPEGTTDLSGFAKFFLLANPNTSSWHTFGMEWKEHVAWITPIAVTVVAYVISTYAPKLANEPKIRNAITWFFVFAFSSAAVAGVLGALITKAAPIR